MIVINNKEDCCGCYACANICPKNCLDMIMDEEGFWYPNIDTNKCINCDLCVKVCPIIENKDKDKNITDNFDKKVYAAKNLNENIRINSSSGGVFTSIAENIIEKGGVVIGVGFNERFEVVHRSVETKEELASVRGSKYVQSKIGYIYREIKKELNKNRLVLFTGTPCQVYGLKKYLDREYKNLITQDIVCHGVPSPIVWEKYVGYIKSKNKYKINNIKFRDKVEGWRNYSLVFKFSNNKKTGKNINEDFYLIAFQNDIILRNSCYECKFKGENRASDITLADFWGIENTNINMDDNKGTSVVVINSQKGDNLFKEISKSLKTVKIDFNIAFEKNKSYYISANKNNSREEFLSELSENNFETMVRRYCNYSYKVEIKKRLKKIVKKILKKIGLYK
ncbi:Coenzyme F420 hydrogenase/dehydrogenase, beta subunit C-terminal domain [Clostridium perfringens]|uniref:Coenzyme F420 hydrogenase/dehydrogenase, beta subunit C-terminal domain n=1 Tax=Clostridium perfringens TaxID=1502 RepID=UPI0039EA08A6